MSKIGLIDFILRLPFPKAIIWKLYRALIDFRFRRFLHMRLGVYSRSTAPDPTPPKELVLEIGAATRDSFEKMFERS